MSEKKTVSLMRKIGSVVMLFIGGSGHVGNLMDFLFGKPLMAGTVVAWFFLLA